MHFHPDKSDILSKEQYLRVTNAYKHLGRELDRDEYDEKELDSQGKLKIGSQIFTFQHFGAFLLISNTLFWSWYYWDDLTNRGGDCPIQNADLGKMRSEGVDWEERRKAMDRLASRRSSSKES